MPEAVFNGLLSGCLIKSLLNQSKQLSCTFRCTLLHETPKYSFHRSKHRLNRELYAIRHFGGRWEVVAVLVDRNTSFLSRRNVSAVDGGASLWLPPVNLWPMVDHGVSGIVVKRYKEHGVPAVCGIAASCLAQLHVVFVVKPFIRAALMEMITCILLDSWQGSEPEPFLELNSHQPTRACPATPLQRIAPDVSSFAGDHGKRLTSAYIRGLADVDMSAAVKNICDDPTDAPAYTERLAFKCSCGSGKCFKAMKLQSVLRAKSVRMQCPGHEIASTHSSFTKTFANILFETDRNAVAIWDLHCVRSRPLMSIDACVLSGGRWHCFEIDGPIHFLSSGTSRNDQDAIKDDAVNASGMRMLRLHHKDRADWPQYVHHFLQSKSTCVMYTRAYKECCSGEIDDACIVAL